MYKLEKKYYFYCFIIAISILLLSKPASSQIPLYPSFGSTSLYPSLGLTSLYPSSGLTSIYPTLGTTSLTNYGLYPSYSNYSYTNYPYYGYTNYSPWSGLGYPAGGGTALDYSKILQAVQYYQYLSYAYQFYQIARMTPMFYQRDIVADYIGSSLYSFATQNELTPQDAILTFIQQYLI